MDAFVWVLLLQFWTFRLVEPLPLEKGTQTIYNFRSEPCDYVIVGGTIGKENTRGTLMHKGGNVADGTSCELHLNGAAVGVLTGRVENLYPIVQLILSDQSYQHTNPSMKCELNSGDMVESCIEIRPTADIVYWSARSLLSTKDLQLEDRDELSRGAVIGGIGGVILLVIVLALCVKSNKPREETVKGVRISRLSSVTQGDVTIDDVKDSLKKCEVSTGPGVQDTSESRKSGETLRNSVTVDSHAGTNSTTQRPSSQLSVGSTDNANRLSGHSQHNGKTIDRRLPQLPPSAATSPMDDDDNPNYERMTTGRESGTVVEPNYQSVDDPSYDKIKSANDGNTAGAKDPNYEKIKSEGATGEDKNQDDLYEEVKNDPSKLYAKVDKGQQSKDKHEDSARMSTASDPYQRVGNDDSARTSTASDPYQRVGNDNEDDDAPPVPEKSDDVTSDLTPPPSPTQNRASSQGQAAATSPVSPSSDGATGSAPKKEPSYAELSVRESIESIKEREAKTKSKRVSSEMYASVDETDGNGYYSTVNTSAVSPQTPPPLPSDSTRPTSNVSTRDVSVKVSTDPAARASVSSEIYASIAGDGEDDPMPVYAQVNKPKRAGSTSAASAPTSKIDRTGRSQSERSDRSSQRSSVTSGQENDPGYERIKELMGDTDPSYQAIDEVKPGDGDGGAMTPGDMVHIDDHKVNKTFWKKKDHMYQSIKEDEKQEETTQKEGGMAEKGGETAEKLSPDDMVHINDHKVKEDFWKKKDHTYQAISDDDDKNTDKKKSDEKK